MIVIEPSHRSEPIDAVTVLSVRDQVRGLPSSDSAWMSASSTTTPAANSSGWPRSNGRGEYAFSGGPTGTTVSRLFRLLS